MTIPVQVLQAATFVVPRRQPGKAVWQGLLHAYGEDAVTATLSRHPIKMTIVKDGHLGVYWDYCSSWLRRYAPDEAITPRATAYLAASSLLIPAWFLTRWSHLYWADVEWVADLVDTSAPWIILYFLYVVLGLRGTHVDEGGLFRRFILVQLLENSREGARRPSESETSRQDDAMAVPGA